MEKINSYQFWAASSVAASIFLVHRAASYSIGGSYIWTATTLFFLQWLIYGTYAVFLYPFFFSPIRHIPTAPGGKFFVGNFPEINAEPSGLPMRRWMDEVPHKGIVRYLHLFNIERLLILSPKALGEVLTTKSYNFVKPRSIRFGLARILGYGLLLTEGDQHKAQRKNLMPAFQFRHIKDLYPTFWAKSKELVQCLQQELDRTAPNNVIEIGGWAGRATLDIVGLAGLGQDFDTLNQPDSELSTTYRKVFKPSKAGFLIGLIGAFVSTKILHGLPIKYNKEMVEAQQTIRALSRDFLQKKKRAAEKKEKHALDIISVALDSGGFTEDELIDQMMTFIAAGHETTASALTWAVHELCQKPECQTLLREEIHANIDSIDDEIDASRLEKLPYLLAVCNETLRHSTIVPIILRDAESDCTICDTYVPKGTKIVISPSAINFNHDLWGPDAAEFKPTRWMGPGRANTGGATSNYAMLTFLHGPRSCIGQAFARAEFACLLAALVGKFEFEMRDPNEKIELSSNLVLKPKHGMHIKMKVLDGW